MGFCSEVAVDGRQLVTNYQFRVNIFWCRSNLFLCRRPFNDRLISLLACSPPAVSQPGPTRLSCSQPAWNLLPPPPLPPLWTKPAWPAIHCGTRVAPGCHGDPRIRVSRQPGASHACLPGPNSATTHVRLRTLLCSQHMWTYNELWRFLGGHWQSFNCAHQHSIQEPPCPLTAPSKRCDFRCDFQWNLPPFQCSFPASNLLNF